MTIEYASLGDYLTDCLAGMSLAVMPVPVVADHLGKTSAAITAMIRAGKLEEIRIKNNRFVKVSSLLDLQDEFENQIRVVTDYLVKLAKNGTHKVYYEPVMTEVDMSPSVPADRTKIGHILGEISQKTYDEKRLLLSVLVHRKAPGTTRPGPGFFDLARHMGFEWDDDDEFVKKQTKLVLKAYSGS